MSCRSTVLLLQSDCASRTAAGDALSAAGFVVIEAVSTDEALGYLEARSGIEVLVSDIERPGCFSGLDLARFVNRRWPHIAVIISGWPCHPTPSFPQTVTFLPGSCPPSTVVEQVRRSLASPLA
jgi:two-component system, response regulator PdtaR